MTASNMAVSDFRTRIEARVAGYLDGLGYQVLKNSRRLGKSGIEHTFDMLAQKDDGITLRTVALDLADDCNKKTIAETIFDFANEAYDAGIKERILICSQPLEDETRKIADKQRIKVVSEDNIETMLGETPASKAETTRTFKFDNKTQLIETLTKLGYHVEEQARVRGRSGVEYVFDILAYASSNRISHSLGIDIFSESMSLSLEKVALFDTKAFDTGLDDRAIALFSTELDVEAKKFVEHQGIKVLELGPPRVVEKGVGLKESDKKPVSTDIKQLRQMPQPDAILLIPEVLARRYSAVPISVSGNTLTMAMADPSDILALEAFSIQSHKRIKAITASAKQIREAIDFNYKSFGEIEKQVSNISFTTLPLDNNLVLDASINTPLVQALNLIVDEAVKARASDIHIEPQEKRLRIRYRIDGTLQDTMSLPMEIHGALISRLKILANMNIADHFRPQDGQFSTDSKQRQIDVRVATAPTVNGEMAVLRLLDKSTATLGLAQLGFLPESLKKFEDMLKIPYGMILVSGPTGAGKTTTLYASLNSLDLLGRNVVTVEDPAEYRFDDINQIQVNNQAGITFAGGLRSILRLDPDVILVGEIRDKETANIAVQAALTGHLMLSSIHANDTVGVLYRLLDLKVEPFLIASSVIGILAQRMVRKMCPDCQQVIEAPVVEQIAFEKATGEKRTKFNYAAGCKTCSFTGYLGRTGIFEILAISDTLRRMVVDGASSTDIYAECIKEGMVSMLADGMEKVKLGLTTPGEILRTTYSMD